MAATKQKIPSPAGAITSSIGAFDNLADAIANPDPSQPLRNSVGQAGRKFCDYYGALPQAAKTLLGPGFSAGSLVCKPYWDKSGYSPPTSTRPFNGGQCPVQYGLTTRRADGQVVGNTLFVFGPVTRVSVFKTSGTNERTIFSGFTAGGAPLTVQRDRGTLGNEAAGSATVYRPDGQPDNCGNLPGDVFPGPTPPPVPPGSPIFPPGEEPGFDPDGQPFFFVPPIPPIITGEEPYQPPAIESPPPPGGGSPPGPSAPGTPGEGTDPEGEAPEGEEIYALVIEFLAVPQYAREIEPGLYVSPCRVFLGTEFGLDLDEAGRAMRSGQAVFAEIDGLTNWRVSASVGFIVRVTPYYREKAT